MNGEVDSGGNRPMDYIDLEAYETATETLKSKQNWDTLTQNEIVVLRHKLHQNGLDKDVVFLDRLGLVRCILHWSQRGIE